MRKLTLAAVAALALAAATASFAADEMVKPERQHWSFAGPFGTYDRAQLQRGFKVYREVCSVCHGLKFVAFRSLAQPGGPGFSEGQAKIVAGEFRINDGPNDLGEMFERLGRLSDSIPSPDPNEQAARARLGGALPPDLSVIVKARSYEVGLVGGLLDFFRQYQESGVDYVYAFLIGYDNPPPGVKLESMQFWNMYFPGYRTAMSQPLQKDQIEYTDGTPQTVEQYSRDVAAFLMWAAEPHLEARKRIGFQVMIFLVVFAGLLYFTKKKIWAEVKDHA
ncbi:MAG: cytochrome c1 [Xanthobacteraceae bacterium]|nr:cytochrome c1 [Xanthobacteraceae bacterium]